MILTCPECATSYFVDDAKVGPSGRVVKCSNCGARWMALPDGVQAPVPAPPPPPPPPPQAAPIDEVVFEAPPAPAPARTPAPRKAAGPVAIWIGAAVAAAVLIAAALVFRTEVVRLLPASEAAYAGLGMPVSSLVIEKVHADAAFQGGRPVLQVSGQVRNTRDQTANAPPLRVSLLDWTGKAVAARVARPIDAPVPGKAIRYFAVTLADPPVSVHDLEITFESDGKPGPPPVKAVVPSTPSAAPSPPAAR